MFGYVYTILALITVLVGAELDITKTNYDLDNAEEYFASFVEKYEKHYESTAEYNRRFIIFKKKLSLINYWNEVHEATFSVNQFADQEPSRNGTGFVLSKLRTEARKLLLNKNRRQKLPPSLDYRDFGLVTEVKRQGECDSCYIFAAVGVIESRYAMLTGEVITLSDQQVLDCVGKPCDQSGDPLNVIRSLADNSLGVQSEEDYLFSYEAMKHYICFNDERQVKVKVVSGDRIETPDEETLKAALVDYGPLAIAIYDTPSLSQYDGRAILKPFDYIGNENSNHAVLLVGYSTDRNGTPYWIIKNSWGKDWGDNGYLYLEMGKGHLSILEQGAVTAVVMRP